MIKKNAIIFQFKELLYRRANPVFYAFDLLWLNGKDLRTLPLLKRKERLRRIITPGLPILYADHVEGNGVRLFQCICALDLEGIVAKRKAGIYSAGWIKIKNPNYTQVQGGMKCLTGSSFAENGDPAPQH
jgi:ATP-dependent DNA ligase